MIHLGDFTWGQTVRGMFPTRLTTGARGNFSNALETSDMRVYKNGSATQRSSESGYTLTSNTFDSLDGIVSWAVDLSDNTDAGFYTPGEYCVVLYPDETLDSLSVATVMATFSILRPSLLMPVIGLAQGGTSTTVQLPTTASSTDGAYAGAAVYVRHATGEVEIFPQAATAYVGSTRTLTIDGTFATTPDTTSYAAPLLGPVAGTSVLPDVNVAQINDTTVQGAGTSGDKWRA